MFRYPLCVVIRCYSIWKRRLSRKALSTDQIEVSPNQAQRETPCLHMMHHPSRIIDRHRTRYPVGLARSELIYSSEQRAAVCVSVCGAYTRSQTLELQHRMQTASCTDGGEGPSVQDPATSPLRRCSLQDWRIRVNAAIHYLPSAHDIS